MKTRVVLLCTCLCLILNVASQDISRAVNRLNSTPKPPTVALQSQRTTDTETLTVLTVGDITVGSRLTPLIETHGPGIFFQATAKLIQEANIAIAFLNTSISDRGEPRHGRNPIFRAAPGFARGLANTGFDAVSLATPHSMDFGFEALEDTLTELEWYHVEPVGAGITGEMAGKPAWIPLRRIRSNIRRAAEITNEIPSFEQGNPPFTGNVEADGFSPSKTSEVGVAVLAYYRQNEFSRYTGDMRANALYSNMVAAVTDARDNAELLIVLLHWGEKAYQENRGEQSRREKQQESAIARQQIFAHALIDAGADMVCCQQLHTLGGIEIYQGKPIVYSLADFIYDAYDKQYLRLVIPKAKFDDGELTSIELIPILTGTADKKYQPSILSGEEAIETLRDYQQRCAPFKTEFLIENERGWIRPK